MVFLNKVFLQKITCKTIDFLIAYLQVLVNQVNPSPPNPGRREKIKVKFLSSHFFVVPQKVL